VKPAPWSSADRPLDGVPIHFPKEVRPWRNLVDALKADLRYAEIAVRDAPQKLNAASFPIN